VRRIGLSVAILSGATLAGPLAAPALPRTPVAVGGYGGHAGVGNHVAFRVTTNRRLVHFRWSGIRLTCTDGDTFTPKGRFDMGSKNGHPNALKITRLGHFDFFVTGHAFRWVVSGRIRRRVGSGTIRVRADFNTQNNPDPNGSVHCYSGNVHFRAVEKPKKKHHH
jgi:hypothetical protein